MNIPKLSRSVLVAGFLGCVLFTQQAQAVLISGAITFKGGVILDTNNVATADAVHSWTNPAVESRDGNFAAFVALNAPVTMSPTLPSWRFDPSTPTPALWAVGGFTFNLTSSTIVHQSSVGLLVSGLGTIVGNGFEATAGSWSFSTQSPSAGQPAVFSFSGATGAPPGGPGVPDGGVTALLLGSVLLGFGAIRRLM